MIEISKMLCIGCGLCVKDCPASAIALENGKAEVKKTCIQCGHCVAVCPSEAVVIPEYEMAEVELFDSESFVIKPETYLKALKFRRSIRTYTGQKIEEDKMRRVLDAGRYTATAKNRQACTFIVVQEELETFKALVWKEMPHILETLKESAPEYVNGFSYFYKRWQRDPKDDVFFFNAPAFLIVTSENPLDGGLASANIENMAVAEELGVLYSGYMMQVLKSSERLREWTGAGNKPISCCMLFGYPAVKYQRTAPRKKADIIWK